MSENGRMSGKNASLTDEFAFIKKVSRMFQTKGHRTIIPTGDDAAVYMPEENQAQIVCVDTMSENIHFKRQTLSTFDIGYKVLAINLSDIAAMGGKAKHFLVSVAVSPQWSYAEMAQIYEGLQAIASEWKVNLLGGDTVSSQHGLTISVTVIGEQDPQQPLLRSQAQPGDTIFMTGHAGLSAAGLHLLLHDDQVGSMDLGRGGQHDLQDEWYERLLKAHQRPTPHLREGSVLSAFAHRCAISLNDVSDGVASEAREIAQSSGVNLVLEEARIPVDPALSRYAQKVGQDPLEWILYGGEDFVLLGTIAEDDQEEIQKKFREENLSFFPIGYVEEGNGEVWLETNKERKPLYKFGYNHFHKDDE